jgi:iron complex transport system substrate-binding protein
LLVAALVVAGCRAPAREAVPPTEEVAGAGRIAVLAPAAAETLVALGAGERVVAIGDWVTWPPELHDRPRLGAYDTPSEEVILALGVDALVTSASVAGRAERARLAARGVRILELDYDTLAGALAAIGVLGRLTGAEAPAAALVARLDAGLAALAARAADLPARRTLVVVGREPLYVAGPGSFLDELLRRVGGENLAADLPRSFALVALEEMLARRPEAILDLSDNRPGALRGPGPGVWGAWPFLPAVAAGRVVFVDPQRLSIPGPRLVEIAETIARAVHPERFGALRPRDYLPLVAEGAR